MIILKTMTKKMEYLKEQIKKIMNNNEEHIDYLLSIIGKCMIGDPQYFGVDKTEFSGGDNGKHSYLTY